MSVGVIIGVAVIVCVWIDSRDSFEQPTAREVAYHRQHIFHDGFRVALGELGNITSEVLDAPLRVRDGPDHRRSRIEEVPRSMALIEEKEFPLYLDAVNIPSDTGNERLVDCVG